MKTSTWAIIAAIGMAGAAAAGPAQACTPTGFYRDGINMTAAVTGIGDISGAHIDATGCNIGIYYGPGSSGTVDSSEISGANYFGVVVSGDADTAAAGAVSVDLTNNTIHDIGEVPLNGTQHGVAIYYRAFDTGASATGTISNNALFNYQKGGIVANGPGTAATISGNVVTGQGPVPYIAQNGIQIGFGAAGQVMRNQVTGNAYSGANNASSAGVLIFGGCGYPTVNGVQIVKNTIGGTGAKDGNDMGIALFNSDPTTCGVPSTATNDKVINNTITNTQVTNISGNGATGYQAAVYDSGNNDKLINNNISGAGYAPSGCSPSAAPLETCATDDGGSSTKVHANSFSP